MEVCHLGVLFLALLLLVQNEKKTDTIKMELRHSKLRKQTEQKSFKQCFWWWMSKRMQILSWLFALQWMNGTEYVS